LTPSPDIIKLLPRVKPLPQKPHPSTKRMPMKKLFVLPALLLFSFCPMTAVKKDIVKQKEKCFSGLKNMIKDSLGLVSTSCGHRLHADWTPEEKELDINLVKYLKDDIRTVATIVQSFLCKKSNRRLKNLNRISN